MQNQLLSRNILRRGMDIHGRVVKVIYLLIFLALFYLSGIPVDAQVNVVSVTATQPIAGATPGVFTIRRTGDTNQPLTVPLSLSGTAVRDVDYTADTQAAGNLPPAFVPGKVAQAFSFDGQGQYVQGPDDPKLDLTEEATIDAWVFFNRLPSANGGMMIADKSDFGHDFLVDAEADNRFHFSIGAGRKVASSTVIQTGRWYHIAATYKALTEVKIYVNGVLENTLAIDQRRGASTGTPFAIGRTLGLAFLVGPAYFSGLIDEVHVFNRVLSDAEIRSIFSADSAGLCKPDIQAPNCAQPPTGLVGWFAGDGDGRNIAETMFSTGKVAQAFAFNGGGTPQAFNSVGQYLQYPSRASQDPTAEATLDAWINFTQLPSEAGRIMTIMAKSADNGRFFDLLAFSDNRIRFYIGFGNFVSTNTVMQKGRWYHIAATFKANVEMRMYVNGVLEDTQAISDGRGTNNSPLTIGTSAFDLTRTFAGLVDEAQMYNRALSTSEILTIYNADSSGLCKPVAVTGCVQPPTGMVGWWAGDGHARDLVTLARGTFVGYDYRSFGQQLTFAAGQTSITVNIRPLFSPNSAGKTAVLTLFPDTQNSYTVDAQTGSAIVALLGQAASTEILPTTISPNKGGNTGSVTTVISGQGFKPGATVKFIRAGQPDIIASQTAPAADEFSITATFDLTGKAPGVYDVVVANAGGTIKTLFGAFVIEQPVPTHLNVEVIARRVIRIGNEYPFYVNYGNSGNTDVINVPFYLSVPSFVSITPDTNLPYQTAQINGRTVISLILPRVRAGSGDTPEVLAVKIKVADPNQFHNRFRLRAAYDLPYVTSAASEPFASSYTDTGIAAINHYITEANGDDGGGDTDPTTPNDPNEKDGPGGVGSQGYIPGSIALPYTIYFENKDTAELPAQDVVVKDQLDPAKVDLSTFHFGVISFGRRTFIPPAGQKSFVGYVDLRPDKNLLLKITANLDATNGLVSWTFNSLDPTTGRPPDDPLAGFLPPNKISPEGQGAVTFTITPKSGIQTNTVITNQARVVFDVNAPIDTPTVTNTIDNSKPVSAVDILPTVSQDSFSVSWSGTDQGSGIGTYTVFVSDNGAAFTPFVSNTPNLSATFTGQNGHTYRFYAIATDLVGNQELAKTTPEATTTVDTAAPRVSVSGRVVTPNGTGVRNVTVSITDSNGFKRTATTSSFGFYSFANVVTGQQYTLRVSSRLYRFASRTLQVTDTLTNIDFVGLE